MRLILAVTSLAQNSGIRACSQVRSCEAVDVTVNFRDSQHGGDKRKKCQQGCPIAVFMSCAFSSTHSAHGLIDEHCALIPGLIVTSSLHKHTAGFTKSKAMLGAIGPCTRARVADLWRDDADTPPNPQQRVTCINYFFALLLNPQGGPPVLCKAAQRGIVATREILLDLLDGLGLPHGTPIFVIDLVVDRCVKSFRHFFYLTV